MTLPFNHAISCVELRRLSRSDLLCLGRWNAHFSIAVTKEHPKATNRSGHIPALYGVHPNGRFLDHGLLPEPQNRGTQQHRES